MAILATASVAGAVLNPDTLGQTTAQQRIVGTNGPGFDTLTLGPGESTYIVREEGIGTAQAGRENRRTALAYFGQLSDFQLADEESPARAEPLDPVAGFASAFRPWESTLPHIAAAMVRQMNTFAGASPHTTGSGSTRPMDFTIDTGDAADSQQYNETVWVRQIVEGGVVNPNSGVVESPVTAPNSPFCESTNGANIDDPPAVDDPTDYTGVQDFDDSYDENTNLYYDPETPLGAFASWPTYPNLMDESQDSFSSPGLNVPHYQAIGNHDGLVQGNLAATTIFEEVATGCIKVEAVAFEGGNTFLNFNQQDIRNAWNAPHPDGDPNAMYVPPDPARRFVSKQQYKEVFQSGTQADGHGFDYVDPAELAASNGAAGYYSFEPVPGLRLIALDTVSEGGALQASAEGNLDHPQFLWLEEELKKATEANELVMLYSHHAPASFQSAPIPDENAPDCTTTDPHGHDVNPGCDVDPRASTPIHLEGDMVNLLHQYPHVIAWVAGHSHEHRVQAYPAPGGGSGFWVVRTAAEADWPQQARLLELFDNEDGTLSLFGTAIDHASNATAPATGTNATTLDENDLASIGRTIGFNDPQYGAPEGENAPSDRNVELLIKDPRRTLQPGRCINPLVGTNGPNTLTGSKFGDKIRGLGGNDVLRGRKGADCVYGGKGIDRVFGERGNDTVSGGAGNDLVHGSDGVDRLNGNKGADRIIAGKGKDKVFGGAGNDRIAAGGGGRDVIKCGKGRRDRAVADRRDVTRGCETVRRP